MTRAPIRRGGRGSFEQAYGTKEPRPGLVAGGPEANASRELPLTSREHAIVTEALAGTSNEDIAARVGVDDLTVLRLIRRTLYRKELFTIQQLRARVQLGQIVLIRGGEMTSGAKWS